MTYLSKHFTIEEMTFSQEAVRAGLRNNPGPDELANLGSLVVNVLEPLRERVRKPVVVTSGYRAPTVNRRIGGARASQHTKGEAADIVVPGMEVPELVMLIRAMKLPYDQLIDEFGRWVHVSHKANGPQRGNVLVARRSGGETVYRSVA